MRRATYHHGDLREALVEAALAVVRERGVAALTLRAVARRAGVSHMAPYHHFADRQALVAALVQRGFERLLAAVRARARRAAGDPLRQFQESAFGYVLFAVRHPALYRVHEGPTPERKVLLQNYLKALGLGLSISDDPQPAEYQSIATATRDRPDAQQIHTMLLRSMQQAIYTPTNSGHFGLAYVAYTHFTSPIRRYPDLLVHRVIKALLQGRRYHLAPATTEAPPPATAARKGGKAAPKASPSLLEADRWAGAGAHCSANERRADEASRDVEAWLKCRFMRDHLGEEYSGTVSAVTSFGIFVTLDELYVEGLVHITELGSEYFRYDEARAELRGEHSGLRYTMGSRVRVQVSRVDLDGRKIDFRMVADGTGEPALARGRKSGSAVQALQELKGMDRKVKAARAKGGPGRGAATKSTRPPKAGRGRRSR